MIESERHFAADQEGNVEEINTESIRKQRDELKGLYEEMIDGKKAEKQARLSIGESYRVNPDGTLDDSAAILNNRAIEGIKIKTEEDVYSFFREFIKEYPEFNVRFEKDPEGKVFRYEIWKNEQK